MVYLFYGMSLRELKGKSLILCITCGKMTYLCCAIEVSKFSLFLGSLSEFKSCISGRGEYHEEDVLTSQGGGKYQWEQDDLF